MPDTAFKKSVNIACRVCARLSCVYTALLFVRDWIVLPDSGEILKFFGLADNRVSMLGVVAIAQKVAPYIEGNKLLVGASAVAIFTAFLALWWVIAAFELGFGGRGSTVTVIIGFVLTVAEAGGFLAAYSYLNARLAGLAGGFFEGLISTTSAPRSAIVFAALALVFAALARFYYTPKETSDENTNKQ